MNETLMTEMDGDIALAGNYESVREPGIRRSVDDRSGWGHSIWSKAPPETQIGLKKGSMVDAD
jgi:hypothetical protein